MLSNSRFPPPLVLIISLGEVVLVFFFLSTFSHACGVISVLVAAATPATAFARVGFLVIFANALAFLFATVSLIPSFSYPSSCNLRLRDAFEPPISRFCFRNEEKNKKKKVLY